LKLLDIVFISEAILETIVEDILSDNCLLGSGCSSEEVEVNVEPLVDVSVDGEVFVADLLAGDFLLEGFGFSGCAVLVCTAYVYSIMANQTAISCKHIC